MNKKISTLMSGLLLTSAFASAQLSFDFNQLEPAPFDATKGMAAGTYLIVLDNNNDQKVDATDQILSVVKDDNGILAYKAYAVSNVQNGTFTVGGDIEKKENLLWTLGINTVTVPTKGYYYSLYNKEAKSYLSFKADQNLITKAEDCKDLLNDAAKGYSYFIADDYTSAAGVVKNGSKFYLAKSGASSHQLQGDNNADVLLGGDASQTLLFCKYKTIEADLDDIVEMNKTMGGEGFNLNFDKLKDYEENVIYEQKFKAFEVQSGLKIDLGDGQVHEVPAGFYLATSYPATLVGKSQITDAKDFLACSFLAVSPTVNKKINGLKPADGNGFEFAIAKAEDMNYVEDFDLDQAAVKGQTYVGNACFTIEIPDFANDEEAYQFKLANIRVWVDGELEEIADRYISAVTSEGKSHIVTNASGVTFKTDNSTILKPKTLLSTEDTPSIFTIQFVSGEEKEENSEYGQYLTVGQAAGSFQLFSTLEEGVENDPLYQFVITDVDTTSKEITFTNRQTKVSFKAILYKEEGDLTYTIYPVNATTFNLAKNDEVAGNPTVTFTSEPFATKKIQLVPVTVEDKFATFNAANEINGLVRFELARTSESDGKFYVYAPRKKKANGDIVLNPGVMIVSEDAADLFELVKVQNNRKDVVEYIENPYVFNKDGKKYTSLKRDTVAYNLYNVKLFAPEEEKEYYVDGTSLVEKAATPTNRNFAIKKNLDGSVSLIYTTDVEQVGANYLEFGGAKKEKEQAWKVGTYYQLARVFNTAKTFMVAEPEAISLEAKSQHISIQGDRGGFISMNADNDGILAIANEASEDLTLWVDTVRSNEAIPSFYITKGGHFMYYATDSLTNSLVGTDKYKLEGGETKLIFKAAELVSSDTLKTVVDGKEVLVATKANAAKKIKGGLGNFQYQIIKDEEGSDEYVIRLTDKYQYVRVINNMLTLDANKKNAARFLIESQATPTANEGIATSEVKVLAGNGNVTIAGAAGKKVVVSNILGQVVANTVVSSDNAVIAAPAGVVVVAVEGEAAVKAIVK